MGEGVAQTFNDLKQRQVHISQAASVNVRSTPADQLLEITEKFRHALFPEFARPFLGFTDLILVIQRRAERMMGVVNLDDKIRDGELQLMQP